MLHGARRRPTLATLRDFNAIEVSGDFGVDVVQEADYSVDLHAAGRKQG